MGALKLVGLNAVRAYPHYLGVFFLVESFSSMRTRFALPLTPPHRASCRPLGGP